MIELQPNGFYKMTPHEEKALIEDQEREYKDGITTTKSIRRRWWMVERYLEGVQWSSAGEAGWTFLSVASNALLANDIFSVNVDENVVVDNLMLRIHMTSVARLIRYKPQIEIAPNQKSKQDNLAVRKGRVALYDLLYKSKWVRLQQSIARHLTTYGITFLKVVYEPNSGKKVRWPVPDPQAEDGLLRDKHGQVVYELKPQGEVKLYAVNPKNLTFPNDCVDVYEADWVQESTVRTTAYVKRKYKKNVKPEPVNFFDQERNGTWESDFKERTQAQDNGDSVIVKERWYRPCDKFPNGAIIIWANGVMLQCKELEKWYPDLPYFSAYNVFNDESVYGDCPAYHLITHQNEINRSESNIARHVNLIGKPKLLLNRDAETADNAFTNETGEIVEWSGKQKPEWLLAPPVSPAIYEHIERHVDRMMAIGYAHDIIRPGRARSGNAIAYEQEIDENTMAPMVQSMTDMMERGLAFALELMARWYKVPRLVKMLDSNAWTIERDFKGEDLFGNFDVRVDFLAGLPANKLAKQQHVIQLFQTGLLEKPVAQKYLEVGEAEEALRAQALEMEIVEKAIATMEKGFTVPPHEWDNHELHIGALERWLRENANLEEVEEEVLAAMEGKLKWHKDYMAAMTQPMPGPEGLGPEAAPGGMPGPVAGGPGAAPGGGGLPVSPEAPEAGADPSFQDQGAGQPAPEEVLQSGPPGV